MKDKENQIEEMMNDIGPERQMEHNGQKISCIFYDKATLAKVLVARGWVKSSDDVVMISKEEYYELKQAKSLLEFREETIKYLEDANIRYAEALELKVNAQERKETAEKILMVGEKYANEFKNNLAMGFGMFLAWIQTNFGVEIKEN